MNRQWLNCPGTEAHAARLAHIKTLGTVGAAREYLHQVWMERGHFWFKWLEEEFSAWLKAQKGDA